MCEGIHIQCTREERDKAVDQLREGDKLVLLHEEGNEHDPDALIVTSTGVPLGYVPQVVSRAVRTLLLSQRSKRVRAVAVGGPQVPLGSRIVVEVKVEAPPNFSFDPRGEWKLAAG
jgi:hypothetical protein